MYKGHVKYVVFFENPCKTAPDFMRFYEELEDARDFCSFLRSNSVKCRLEDIYGNIVNDLVL